MDKDGKEVKPPPLTPSEQTRNAVIRTAAVGQEAIDNNERSMGDVKAKYDAKAAQQKEEDDFKAKEAAVDAEHAKFVSAQDHAARNDTADEIWTASHAATADPVKKPILQTTVVYAQESN